MDYQDNWQEVYHAAESSQPDDNPQPVRIRKKRERKGVSVMALVSCTLAAVLLGGALGGLFTKRYVDRSVSAALADSAASLSNTAPAPVLNENTSLSATAFAETASKAQIIELCAPTVVGIDVTYPQTAGSGSGFGGWQQGAEKPTGSGSGIVLTSDGYIVTCAHVVADAESVTVVLNDDTSYEATLVGTDERNDLAVLKIDAEGLTPTTLGDSDMLTVGEEVIAIGNPLGELRGTATSGIISAANRAVTVENNDMTLLQTDAAISPGNSGGGLFNASGSLVGIVNAKASANDAEGLGFAIPVNSVKQIISDLMEHGYVRGRAYLGVYTQDVTLRSENNGWGGSQYFGSFFGSGMNCVQVAQVVAGSAAETAGLKIGDLILAVDDKEISSNAALSSAIGEYNAGDTATLSIQRDGEEIKLDVTFGEYSPAVSA